MRRSLVTVLLAAACGASAPPPAPVYGNTPRANARRVAPAPAPEAVEIEFVRAVGDLDRAMMQRLLRDHAATCRQRGARGVATLELALADRPDRRGLRVITVAGDADLRGCLGEVLAAAAWPTGRLDGIALYTVTFRVAR